jgi:hypothetical protein
MDRAHGADQAVRDRVFQTERIANRDDRIPRPHRVAIAEREAREAVGVDANERQVVLRVGSQHLDDVELARVDHLDRNVRARDDDVKVGGDPSVWTDDEAGANPATCVERDYGGHRAGRNVGGRERDAAGAGRRRWLRGRCRARRDALSRPGARHDTRKADSEKQARAHSPERKCCRPHRCPATRSGPSHQTHRMGLGARHSADSLDQPRPQASPRPEIDAPLGSGIRHTQ